MEVIYSQKNQPLGIQPVSLVIQSLQVYPGRSYVFGYWINSPSPNAPPWTVQKRFAYLSANGIVQAIDIASFSGTGWKYVEFPAVTTNAGQTTMDFRIGFATSLVGAPYSIPTIFYFDQITVKDITDGLAS
jgi:hypothetical protein